MNNFSMNSASLRFSTSASHRYFGNLVFLSFPKCTRNTLKQLQSQCGEVTLIHSKSVLELRSCSLHGKDVAKLRKTNFFEPQLSITFLTHNVFRKSTQFEKSRKFLARATHREALKCSCTVKSCIRMVSAVAYSILAHNTRRYVL